MTAAALLISDMHLDEAKPVLTDILFRFLRGQARTAPELYLLGDLFNYYVGDDTDEPLVASFANEVKAVADSGTKVFAIHGNRDFLMAEKFAVLGGLTILPDPTVRKIGGVDTLLTHGDRYCTNDKEYMQQRAMFRSPQGIQMILGKSLAERHVMAAHLRQKSIETQKAAGRPMDAGDVADDTLIKEMSEKSVHRLIHGHTHKPAEHQVTLPDGSKAERIVLSDWRDHGQALEIRSDGSFVRHELT